MPDPLINQTIGGCEIIEIIGHGGMGVIYKARQKSLDRIVAMKVLAHKLANDINFVARFQREARAIARVNHPNILAVYDVGTESDTHYMIMELIDGQSLAEMQAAIGGPVRLDDACNFVLGSAHGLEAAHAAGITHRDIKPENLMITKKGVVKVSDFGLAKESDATGATSTDAVMGTPAFMSPEQCDGKKVDGRTDQYSLGGTFYKLVTGRLPFEAETAMSMMYRHKHEALIPPKEIVPSLPKTISDVIVKMMAKKPDQRYQSMTELITALEASIRMKDQAPPRAAAEPQIVMPAPGGGGALPPAAPPPPGRGAAAGFGSGLHEAPPPGMSGRMSRPVGGGHTERFARDAFGGSARSAASSAQMGAPDVFGQSDEDPFHMVQRGDELLGRGDRAGGLKFYRDALATGALDAATRDRVQTEITNEVNTRRQAGENLLKRGLLVEAGRELRLLIDLEPQNEEMKAKLKEIDQKLSAKRTLINDIRTAIGALQFEKAIEMWDRCPLDLRDESLGKQIEHLRSVVVPSQKLCDQGEKYNKEGRLDEAIATFQDALRLDENCERARQGLSEGEMKKNRIESMLKEGYEFSLKQDYERAVEMWKPILRIQPGHARAMKSIVDSYMAMAREFRAKGDLVTALKAYKDAQEVDAGNLNVKREVEQMQELVDKEQALTERAAEAAEKGNIGEAIRYWREVLVNNGAHKTARDRIDKLKRRRAKGSAKTFAILAVAGILLLVAWQFYSEFAAKGRAQEAMDVADFGRALEHLNNQSFIMDKETPKKLIKDATIGKLETEAISLTETGDLVGAADKYEQAAGWASDEARGPKFLAEAKLLLARHELDLGEKSVGGRKWTLAVKHFKQCREYAQHPDVHGDQRGIALADKAVKAMNFVEKLEEGLSLKERDRRAAISAVKAAIKSRPESQLAQEVLKELGYDPSEYETQVKKAIAELMHPEKPASAAAAIEALERALKADPDQDKAEVMLQYAQDMKKCVDKGMVLFNRAMPDADNFRWMPGDRSSAYCIDRFEYPNTRDSPPQTATFLEAKQLCQRQGKTLCTSKQWQDACRAKDFRLYTYGQRFNAGTCQVSAKAAVPSGTKPGCFNQIGAYDMSGNLAEWALDERVAGGNARAFGGSFKSSAENDSQCIFTETLNKEQKAGHVGFRCCLDLPQ